MEDLIRPWMSDVSIFFWGLGFIAKQKAVEVLDVRREHELQISRVLHCKAS